MSGPLDDTRASELGRVIAETVARQLMCSDDPLVAIGIFEARIQSEVAQAGTVCRKSPSNRGKPNVKLAEVLETFAMADHYGRR